MNIKQMAGVFAAMIATLCISFVAVSTAEVNSSIRIRVISGTVTNVDGEPLAGIQVYADPVQSIDIDYDYTRVTTDENGAYSIAVPEGVYSLNYYDSNGPYFETWYGGATWWSAAELPVPATGLTGIDVVMSRGSTISGKVAFADGMASGAYTHLELIQMVDRGEETYWDLVGRAEVYEGDSWTFTHIWDGTFRICAYNNGNDEATGTEINAHQCYGGTNPDDAADITVGIEENLDGIVLMFTPSTYAITGMVTDDEGNPIGGIDIYGYRLNETEYIHSLQTISNEDGTYSLPVNNGTYDISFNNRYQSVFINGITVDGTDVNDIDMVMQRDYDITGTLLTEDGSTVHKARVVVYQWFEVSEGYPVGVGQEASEEGGWMSILSEYTHQTNDYSILGLQPGTYRVCASAYDEMLNTGGQMCYGGGSDPADGTDVIVGDGADTTGIDININNNIEMSMIVGVVTDEDGDPLEGIEVSAEYDWITDLEDIYDEGYGRTTTAVDGSFEIPASPSSYIVRFNDYSGNHISETYDDQVGHIYDGYTPVTVTNSGTTVVTAALATASKLVGTISLEEGTIAYGSVELLESNEDNEDKESGRYDSVGWSEIMPDGTYNVGGLVAGTYRVCYWFDIGVSGDYDDYGQSHYECYDGASTPEDGTDIILGDSETVTLDIPIETIVQINPEDPNGAIILPEDSGVITGTVASTSGEPLPSIKVQLYKPLPEPEDAFYGAYEVVYTFTDENGQYKIGSLPDGTYHVGFSDPMGAYADGFYNGRNELHNSTPITVGGGKRVMNVDGTLAIAGQIGGVVGLGTITNTSRSVQLSLMDVNGYEVAWGSPDADGNYLFGGLPAGGYILYAYTWDGNYRGEHYEDSQFFEDATPITVVAGEMTVIDFVLDTPADPLIISSNSDMMWADPWTGAINLFIDPWMPETVLAAESTCAEGTTTMAATLIIGWVWNEWNNTEFEMSQNETGSWSATITAYDWTEGNVMINWTCDDEVVVQEVGSSMLYDPSGTIVNVETGAPIEGATATLYQLPNALPDTADEERNCRSVETLTGGWADEPLAAIDVGVVASVDLTRSQPNFEPAVPTQVTAEDGVFGWDVAEGCWYVVASAPGYESSSSPVVGVPPEVTGLVIELTPVETIPTAVSLTNVDTTPAISITTTAILLATLASGVLVVNRKK